MMSLSNNRLVSVLRFVTLLAAGAGLLTTLQHGAAQAQTVEITVNVSDLKGRVLSLDQLDRSLSGRVVSPALDGNDDVAVKAFVLQGNDVGPGSSAILSVQSPPRGNPAVGPLTTKGGTVTLNVPISASSLAPTSREDAMIVLTFGRIKASGAVTAISPFLAIPQGQTGTIKYTLEIAVPELPLVQMPCPPLQYYCEPPCGAFGHMRHHGHRHHW